MGGRLKRDMCIDIADLPAKAGDAVSIPGVGRSPGKGDETHFSIFAWKIPWTEEPGRLQTIGLQRVGQD